MYGKVFYHVKLYVYGYTNNLRGQMNYDVAV
jgi:hypothetical protein